MIRFSATSKTPELYNESLTTWRDPCFSWVPNSELLHFTRTEERDACIDSKNWSDTKYTRTPFSAKLNQEPIKTAKTMSSTELNQHGMQRSWSFVELNIDKRCSELRDRRRLARASTSTIYWKYCCAELPLEAGKDVATNLPALKRLWQN